MASLVLCYDIKGSFGLSLQGRYWFITLSVFIRGKHHVWAWMSPGGFALTLCSNNTQEEDRPEVLTFPLPFRPALRHFKDSIRRRAFKTHRITLLSKVLMYGALCRLEQQTCDCFNSYQWFGFVKEKFRGKCIILNSYYFRERDASDILMQELELF